MSEITRDIGEFETWLAGSKATHAHAQTPYTGTAIEVIDGAAEHPLFARALELRVEELAEMRPGDGRNPALNAAAWYLGRFPVERERIREALMEACEDNGLVDDYGRKDCLRTIGNGFKGADEAGMHEVDGGWTGYTEVTADELETIIRGTSALKPSPAPASPPAPAPAPAPAPTLTVVADADADADDDDADDGDDDTAGRVTTADGEMPEPPTFDPEGTSAGTSDESGSDTPKFDPEGASDTGSAATGADAQTEKLIRDAMLKLHVASEAKKRYADIVATTDIEIWEDLPPDVGGTFLFDDVCEAPTLWGRGDEVLWSSGEAFMIVGPSGLGKTTLAILILAAQLGLAAEVLGLPVPTIPGKILYLAMDRPRQIRKAMLRRLGPENRAVIDEKLVVRKGPPVTDLLARPSLITEMARSVGADIVYIDSLKDIVLGLSEDAVGAGYNRARQHALAHDINVLELHHTVKRNVNGGAPKDIADVYGSAWLTAGAGTVIVLSGKAGDPLIDLRQVKMSAEEVGPFRIEVDHAAGDMRVTHGVDALEMGTDPDGITARDFAVALFDNEDVSRGEVAKAKRRLDALVDAGQMTRIEGSVGGGTKAQPTRYFASGGVREVEPWDLA